MHKASSVDKQADGHSKGHMPKLDMGQSPDKGPSRRAGSEDRGKARGESKERRRSSRHDKEKKSRHSRDRQGSRERSRERDRERRHKERKSRSLLLCLSLF